MAFLDSFLVPFTVNFFVTELQGSHKNKAQEPSIGNFQGVVSQLRGARG